MAGRRAVTAAWAAAALLLAALPSVTRGYEFDMTFQTKCVIEDVGEDTMVRGGFRAFHRDNPQAEVHVDLQIEDPNHHVVFEKSGPDAGFQFTSTVDGEYKLCFTAHDYHTAQTTRIRIEWRMGADAQDWEAVAKKDNLNAFQIEMRKLEQTVHDIHLELQHIRRKEERMRDVNESTNSRVAWFAIFAAFICVALAALQLLYLNKFFKRKKLL